MGDGEARGLGKDQTVLAALPNYLAVAQLRPAATVLWKASAHTNLTSICGGSPVIPLQTRRARGGRVPTPARGPMKPSYVVLVVDDQASVRFPIVEFLKQAGFSVIESDNGAEAVRLAAEHKPDAILLDVVMPVMNGLDAADAMSRTPGLESVPIVLMSGRPTQAILERASAIGCVNFLTKPYSPMAIVAEISHWVRVGKSTMAPGPHR